MASGFFVTSSLNWGVNFLAFLPWQIFFLYGIAGLVILTLGLRWQPAGFLERSAPLAERRVPLFLAAVLALFVVAAFVFRVKVSIWGDGITLVKDIVDHAEGLSPLDPWSEPFSIYFFYAAVTALGPLDFAHIASSFIIIQLVTGVLVIVGFFAIVKTLLPDPVHRTMTFLLLLVLPYMEFFFGYIETYPPAMLTLVLFVLLSLLVLKERASFAFVPPLWIVLTFTHYINGLYLPSVVYLAYREYHAGRRKSVIAGFGAAAGVLAVILTLVSITSQRLIDLSPVSHFLSLTGDISPMNAYSQAYTILSPFHIADLLNYLVLMAPFALLIIIILAVRRKRELLAQDPVGQWFAAALVPVFGYLLLAKLEQGTANDWDVFAGHFIPLTLFAAYLYWRFVTKDAVRTFVLILAMSALQSTIWFSANATTEQNIRRFQTMWDNRILSQLGQYTMSLRLTRYYDAIGDTLKEIDTWDRYTALYPGDPRGYDNEIASIDLFAPGDFRRRVEVYDRWVRIDPSNDSLRRVAAGACLSAGNVSFGHGALDSAAALYAKALAYDSTLSKAYNNLGSVLAQKGQLDRAKALFAKAIGIDPGYGDAYYNLGNASYDTGDPRGGSGNLIAAARLGNASAQEALRKRGIRW